MHTSKNKAGASLSNTALILGTCSLILACGGQKANFVGSNVKIPPSEKKLTPTQVNVAAVQGKSTEQKKVSEVVPTPKEAAIVQAPALAAPTAIPPVPAVIPPVLTALPSVPPLTLPPVCRVDLKTMFTGFALKGGTGVSISDSPEAYPGEHIQLKFADPAKLSYLAGNLQALSGVKAQEDVGVDISISKVPECAATVTVKLLPDDSFAVNSVLERGMRGKLYPVPVGQGQLPDFTKLVSIGTVFMADVNVPRQSFSNGFPGVMSDLKDWFAIDLYSLLLIETEGDYQFKLTSDDGSKLFLNNMLTIDNDGQHSATEKESLVVHLTRGAVPLHLPYYQGPGSELALQLFYKGPGATTWTIIPQSMLRVTDL